MDSHGFWVEAQCEGEDTGGHAVAVVEDITTRPQTEWLNRFPIQRRSSLSDAKVGVIPSGSSGADRIDLPRQ